MAEFAGLVGGVVATEHDADCMAHVPVGQEARIDCEEQAATQQQHYQRGSPHGVHELQGQLLDLLHEKRTVAGIGGAE